MKVWVEVACDKSWGFRVSWRWCVWVGGGVSEGGDGEFLECMSLIMIVCANRARCRDNVNPVSKVRDEMMFL